MQIHQIKQKTKKKKKKIIGRGGKRGTYSGRGIKGQKSRAGRRIRPELRDVIKRIPKRRGYRFSSIQKKPTVLNIGILEKKFGKNEKISKETLFEKGLIKKIKGKFPNIKLLGAGEITKPLLVSECQISNKAKDKIEKAGGEYVE